MEYKVYLIGHADKHAWKLEQHNQAFRDADVPVSMERLEVQPVNFNRVINELTREPYFLGAEISVPYKTSVLSYCQELSLSAQSIGAVNSIARRSSGLIYGHNTDVAAFVQCFRDERVKRVRTALILGAGGAARVALAGLRELSCARYLIGYRHPRRPPELSSQFKGIRRQISFFPLEEMQQFFDWAMSRQLFAHLDSSMVDGSNGNQSSEPKRWDLLVNATPVGQGGSGSEPLITAPHFLGCFARILDMVPRPDETPLVSMAKDQGVPVISGQSLAQLQAEYTREMWLREYRRSIGQEKPTSSGRARRRISIKRRER